MTKQQAQFTSINSYALKTTTSRPKNPPADWTPKTTVEGVCGEGMHMEGFDQHLTKPVDVDLVFGMHPMDLYTDIKARFKEIKKSGVRIKADQSVMCSGIVSYPATEVDDNFFMWLDDSMNFLKEKYGDKLKSIVVHYDESHLHAHYFLADMKTLSVNELDPTRIARVSEENKKKAAGKNEEGKWIYAPKMQAQKDALKEWLDDYHEKVSSKYGHERDIGARKGRIYGTTRQVKQKLEIIKEKKELETWEMSLRRNEEELKQKRDKLMNFANQLLEGQKQLETEKVAVVEKSATFDLLIEQLQVEVERLKAIGDTKTATIVGSRIVEMRQKSLASSSASAFKRTH